MHRMATLEKSLQKLLHVIIHPWVKTLFSEGMSLTQKRLPFNIIEENPFEPQGSP